MVSVIEASRGEEHISFYASPSFSRVKLTVVEGDGKEESQYGVGWLAGQRWKGVFNSGELWEVSEM